MELKKKSKAILRNKAASSYSLISNFITELYQLKQHNYLSLVDKRVKNPPAMQETWVQSLGWEDPLEEGMADHSGIPAWRIPWTEDLAGYSPWGCKEWDRTEATKHSTARDQMYELKQYDSGRKTDT